MNDNVVMLRARTNIGADLRQLAEMADRNELKAYAMTFVTEDDTVSRWYCNSGGRRIGNALMFGASMLWHSMCAKAHGEAEDDPGTGG